jgi:hypothetical protein
VDETATISDWRRTNQVREVTAQEGAALARRMSSDLGMPVPFLETSAKLNRNVSAAFGGAPSSASHLHRQSLTPRHWRNLVGRTGLALLELQRTGWLDAGGSQVVPPPKRRNSGTQKPYPRVKCCLS